MKEYGPFYLENSRIVLINVGLYKQGLVEYFAKHGYAYQKDTGYIVDDIWIDVDPSGIDIRRGSKLVAHYACDWHYSNIANIAMNIISINRHKNNKKTPDKEDCAIGYVMKYDIVFGLCISEIKQEINSRLNDGWELHGDLKLTKKYEFVQAMIKKEDADRIGGNES